MSDTQNSEGMTRCMGMKSTGLLVFMRPTAGPTPPIRPGVRGPATDAVRASRESRRFPSAQRGPIGSQKTNYDRRRGAGYREASKIELASWGQRMRKPVAPRRLRE